VVERLVRVQVPLAPTRRDWPRLLEEFVGQLSDGRVYDRDLPGLARQLETVLQAYRWRARLTGVPVVY
jgi:transcriptional regulator of aromatic amino acid metabolism